MATLEKYNQPPTFNDHVYYLMNQFLSDLIPYEHLICFIYAGLHPSHSILNRPTNDILNQIDEAYTEGKRNIFFDCIGEGITKDATYIVHDVARTVKQKYPDVKCFLLTGSSNGTEAYHSFCNRFELTPVLEIISCYYFECAMNNRWSMSLFNSNYSLEKRSKIYTCLNRVMRVHRVQFLDKVIAKKLVDDRCYYSFYNELLEDGGVSQFDGFKKHRVIKVDNILENIELVKTLRLNHDPNRINPADLRVEDFYLYQDSYFSVIPETGYYNPAQWEYNIEPLENCIFLSEKTYKPILLRQPFILLARTNSLKDLHKRGFKTFHPYIDESYDSVENDELRMDMIVNEIERLSNQTEEEWDTWVRNVKPIVDHNFDEIVSHTDYLVDKDLIQRLNII